MSTKKSEQRAEYFEKLTGIKKPVTTLHQARKWTGVSSSHLSDELMQTAIDQSEVLRDLFYQWLPKARKELDMK